MNIPNEGGIWTMSDAEFNRELHHLEDAMKALTIIAAILLLAGLVATAIGYGFTIFIGT